MVYQYKTNLPYRFPVSAQVAGDVCEKLEREGRLTPNALVDESRPADAPLHAAFEWDDAIAGEEWRRHQARNLIGALIIVTEPEKPSVRGFYKIESRSGGYEAIGTILKTESKYAALLKTAKSELTNFARKYRSLTELTPVFDAIRLVTDETP